MHADNFDLQRYFDRIGYQGPAEPTLAVVTALMGRQLQSVPFENLDVLAGKPISLEPERIVEKILERRRGGYCYEVNGLLAMAFTALQVPFRFVGCRPMTYPMRRPRTHMALLATLEGEEWLCDVGFGSYGIRAPMRLSETEAVQQGYDRFHLAPTETKEYLLRAWVDGVWANQYGFDLSHHEWVDFLPANWLNSTHPETLFTRHRVIMRQSPDGRSILLDNRLKRVAKGETEVMELTDSEVPEVLWSEFGLELDAD